MLSVPEGWEPIGEKLSHNQWLWVSEDRKKGCVVEKRFDRFGYEIKRVFPSEFSSHWIFSLGEVSK